MDLPTPVRSASARKADPLPPPQLKGPLNKKLLSIAALLTVAGLFAAGCGGDNDSSSSDPAPTKAAYIVKADAICAADQSDFEAIVQDLPGDIEAPESQTAITEEIVPLFRDQIEQLRALTPPDGDEETTAAIYDAVDEATNLVEENPSALDQADLFDEADTLATDYGLKVCGN